MKKSLIAVATAALVLGGCTKGTVLEPDNQTARVSFSAGTTNVIETRAGGQDYTGVIGINPSWEIAPAALAFTGNLSTAASALTISGTAVSGGAVTVSATGVNNAQFVSLGVASGTVAPVTGSATDYTIAADADATSLANDYIYASVATPVNGDATVALAYHHVMAKLRIEVYDQNIADSTKITTGVTVSKMDSLQLQRNATINIATGVVSPAVAPAYLASDIAINTEYYLLPTTNMNALGHNFTVTYQGKTYNVKIPANTTLVANKCRVLRLRLVGGGITFRATLEDWTDENTDIDIR